MTPAGNSTISGVINGTSSTFNSLDSIKATGTGNTLNIADQTSTATSTFPIVTVTGVQTANIQSVSAPQLDTSGWTGLTALNITSSTGADVITAASTAATTVTNTLATAASGATAAASTTIDGGTTVNLTATGTISAANGSTTANSGVINVGGTTAPTGNVTVTATETQSASSAAGTVADKFGAISAASGAGVTINATENVGSMVNATAGAISATGGTGAVSVTATSNVTEIDNDMTTSAFTTAAVNATGGSSITVNDVVTASTASLAAALGTLTTNEYTVTQGTVTVLDGGTATTVTVNQTGPATAAKGTAATTATASSTAAGGPGYSSVTAAGSAAAALVPATLGVVNGAVMVSSGSSAGTGVGNASSTITSVSLNNFQAGSYINSKVLNTVTLAGTLSGSAGAATGALTIYNNASPVLSTLALNLNGFTDSSTATTGTAGLNIANNGVKTLNVTTGGSAGSNLKAITDTALTTLNVSGSQVFTLDALPSSLTTITVSGSAGFSDNNALVGGSGTGVSGLTLTSFTTTSSGQITAELGATQAFTGSTGQDVIAIAADHTSGAIKGGSATNNELVLGAASSTFHSGSANTWGLVSGFTTLGISSASIDGTYNLGAMGSNTFNSIEVISGNGTTATFTNVAKGASLSVDTTDTTAGALNYQAADATGASDSVTVNLGTTANGNITLGNSTDTGGSIATSSLVMQDANNVGIGTLNIVSNDTSTGAAAGNVNTIVALADSGLANLNVSGVDGLTITNLNEGTTAGNSATAATAFAVNNTSGGAVTITTFTDSALGSLSFAGTGNDVINSLTGMSGHVLSISNTGSGSATIQNLGHNTNLTSLTLSGSVAVGPDGPILAPTTVTAGVAGTSVPSTVFTLGALSQGQSYTIDGLTITALDGSATGATEATQLAAGTSNTHYQITGSLATPTGWTGPATLAASTNTVTLSETTKEAVSYSTNANQSEANGSTTGVTVAAGTDNAHINLNLTGAASGSTDSITVGNGNDYITDGSSAGTVNVTVGTGSNLIDLHTSGNNTTYVASVTLGTHTASTGSDEVIVGVTGSQTSGILGSVTGAVTGDIIQFHSDAGQSVVQTLTTAQQTTITGLSTLASAITTAFTDAKAATGSAAHDVLAFTYGGNTYIINDTANTGAFIAGTDSVIEIVGSHTIAATTNASFATVHLAS